MKMRNSILAIGTAFMCLLYIVFPAMAQEQVENANLNAGEIVFLLDASGSMNTQDKGQFAIDAIRQTIYSLPSGYRVGLVVYNTQIQAVETLDSSLEQIETQLDAIKYIGYTNAGAGLSQAVNLFSTEQGTSRYILMLSDGEIDMPDSQGKDVSRTLYAKAAEQARERGIEICIIAVGNMMNPQMHIFDGAEMTNGAIYWEGASGSLTGIMNRLITDRVGFLRESVEVIDAGEGRLHIEVMEGVSHLKILVTSENGISGMTADYAAESGQIISGKHFSVVNLSRPEPGAVDVHFQTTDLSGAQAYIVTEFNVKPQVSVEYRREELPRQKVEVWKNSPPKYKHWADVSIEIVDTGGKHKNLWNREAFEGREITYWLNGTAYRGIIQQGQIRTSIPADGIDTVEVSVDHSGLEGIYYVEQPVVEKIMKTPDPLFEPATDYRPMWAILGALAAILAVILGMWIKEKNTSVMYIKQYPDSKELKKVAKKGCTYSGKFNMYVVRTGDERDIAPQTYRLFGRSNGRMTLNYILKTCKINFEKIGAEKISFYPGNDHSVIITDQSEQCTVLKGTEILKKEIGYPIFYGEKITITFEDEITEMEIYYKNLKPSERESVE